jgi:hypothetical protein
MLAPQNKYLVRGSVVERERLCAGAVVHEISRAYVMRSAAQEFFETVLAVNECLLIVLVVKSWFHTHNRDRLIRSLYQLSAKLQGVCRDTTRVPHHVNHRGQFNTENSTRKR